MKFELAEFRKESLLKNESVARQDIKSILADDDSQLQKVKSELAQVRSELANVKSSLEQKLDAVLSQLGQQLTQ